MKNLKMMAIVAFGTAMALTLVIAFSKPAHVLAAPPSIKTTQRSAVIQGVVPGNIGVIDAYCQTGETVTGGGFRWGQYICDPTTGACDFAVLIGQQGDVARSSQRIDPTFGSGWRVVVLNTGTLNIDIEADVMCAKLG